MIGVARGVEYAIQIPAGKRDGVRQLVENWPDQVVPREEPHCEYAYEITARTDRLIVRQYTNGKLHIQGRGETLFNRLLTQLHSRLSDSKLESPIYPYVGTDEAGKGDYYGPLVIAGVYLTAKWADQLESWGVSDSKTLSDRRCLQLGKKIQSDMGELANALVLMPRTYNQLYARFKREGKNLNDLLAWGHSRVVLNLQRRLTSAEPPFIAIVDQFAAPAVLAGRLGGRGIKLIQIERGEQFIGVAAASMVARYLFLYQLEQLSKGIGEALPKGGGERTVSVGRCLVKKFGHSILNEIAKRHFVNTQKILSKGV